MLYLEDVRNSNPDVLTLMSRSAPVIFGLYRANASAGNR
jgi:hypothetical protein